MPCLYLLDQVDDVFLQVCIVRTAMEDMIVVRDDIETTQAKRDVVSHDGYGNLELGLSALKWNVQIKTSPLFKVA